MEIAVRVSRFNQETVIFYDLFSVTKKITEAEFWLALVVSPLVSQKSLLLHSRGLRSKKNNQNTADLIVQIYCPFSVEFSFLNKLCITVRRSWPTTPILLMRNWRNYISMFNMFTNILNISINIFSCH